MKTSLQAMRSVAVLVILVFSAAMPSVANGQEVCIYGAGGPAARIRVGQTTFSMGTWGVDATSSGSPALSNCPNCVDSYGKKAIDVSGVYFDAATGTQFSVTAVPDGRPAPPRVWVDLGSNANSIFVLADAIVTADAVPAEGGTITFSFNADAALGTCPGGHTYTFGAGVGCCFLGPNPTGVLHAATTWTDAGTNVILKTFSFEANTPGHPLMPGGLFIQEQRDNIACGIAGGRCNLRREDDVTVTFINAGNAIYFDSGSMYVFGP